MAIIGLGGSPADHLSFVLNNPSVQCLFATGLTMADGILTPAVSVTSAAAGIAVAKPSVGSADDIVGISLVCIFPSRLQPPPLVIDLS